MYGSYCLMTVHACLDAVELCQCPRWRAAMRQRGPVTNALLTDVSRYAVGIPTVARDAHKTKRSC